MVEHKLPKLDTGVRFPSLAPFMLLALALAVSGCGTSGAHTKTTASSAASQEIANVRIATPSGQKLHTARDAFAWPLRGQIISQFGDKMDRARNKGIDIQAYQGKDVRASRSGTVVFRDDQLKGFGKTVILDHGDNYQTVYAYNSDILVRVGDTIPQDAVIAKAGNTGRAKEPSLHFEIRKNGEPRDPFFYLPK